MAEKASKDAAPGLPPRRVLHIDTSTTFRGAQAQLLHIVKGMEAAGWPVHVACPVESPLWEAVAFLGDRRITISADLSERTAAKVFRAQPDLVAAHSLTGYADCASLPLPLVLHRTMPDLPPGLWFDRRPEAFVATSETVARSLRRLGIRNTLVINEGVEPLPDPTGPALDAPAVLVSDTAPGHPDSETLAGAAALLEGVDFGILARGPGAHNGVRWLGARPDVSNLMEGSQAFVQLSLIDGLASPVIQAMRHGLPVIVSDAPGLPEVVGGSGHVIPQGDSKALVEVVRQVLAGGKGDTDGARTRAESLYSVERLVKSAMQGYDGVIRAAAYRWGGA